jgi:hypothetical protein
MWYTGSTFREDDNMTNHTYTEIASDYCLWVEYVDTDATMAEAEFDATSIEEKVRLQTEAFGTVIRINGVETAVPEGAVAYKYADPTEDARWVYDEDDAADIRREDPSLLVEVA